MESLKIQEMDFCFLWAHHTVISGYLMVSLCSCLQLQKLKEHCNTVPQAIKVVFFHLCVSTLLKGRAVLLKTWQQSIALFHHGWYSTPSICGTNSLACELLRDMAAWLALWLLDCLLQCETGKRTAGLEPVFSPISCLQDACLCMVTGSCPSLWDISPQSYVSDCSLYTCTGCHPSCRNCIGPGASHCLQCWAPEDVLQPHQPVEGAVHGFCLSHCQAQFYLDVTGVCKRELRMETLLWGFKHKAVLDVMFLVASYYVCF